MVFVYGRFVEMIGIHEGKLLNQNIEEMIPDNDFTFSDSVFLKRIKIGNYQSMTQISYYKTLGSKDGIIALFCFKIHLKLRKWP